MKIRKNKIQQKKTLIHNKTQKCNLIIFVYVVSGGTFSLFRFLFKKKGKFIQIIIVVESTKAIEQ